MDDQTSTEGSNDQVLRRPVTSKEILIAARAKIADPHGWIKGAYSKNCPSGWAYCALGAIKDNPGKECTSEQIEACLLLSNALPDPNTSMHYATRITDYNDLETTTHADVLSLYDRAIEAAAS